MAGGNGLKILEYGISSIEAWVETDDLGMGKLTTTLIIITMIMNITVICNIGMIAQPQTLYKGYGRDL